MTSTAIASKRIFETEDGYEFTENEDGTLTDGDITFESLAQLRRYVEVEEIE